MQTKIKHQNGVSAQSKTHDFGFLWIKRWPEFIAEFFKLVFSVIALEILIYFVVFVLFCIWSLFAG